MRPRIAFNFGAISKKRRGDACAVQSLHEMIDSIDGIAQIGRLNRRRHHESGQCFAC